MTEIAERRVPAFAVVETLGVLEDALRAAAWVDQRFRQAGRLSRYRRPRLALPECSSAAPPRTSGQPTPRPMFASVSASACSTWSASSALVVDRWIVTVELPDSASATCSQPW